MNDTVIEARGLGYRYGRQAALDGVDLSCRSGSLTALLGPNGAGKTTLVKLLLGVFAPQNGSLRVAGGDPRQRHIRQQIGTMLQISGVPETLTVAELVAMFSSFYPSPLSQNSNPRCTVNANTSTTLSDVSTTPMVVPNVRLLLRRDLSAATAATIANTNAAVAQLVGPIRPNGTRAADVDTVSQKATTSSPTPPRPSAAENQPSSRGCGARTPVLSKRLPTAANGNPNTATSSTNIGAMPQASAP